MFIYFFISYRRPSSKLLHIPDNVSKNNEIKNDTEESIEYYQTT